MAPWTAKDAKKHTRKANTPAKQKKWARIATGVLKSGKSESSAIRIANAAIAGKAKHKKRTNKRNW